MTRHELTTFVDYAFANFDKFHVVEKDAYTWYAFAEGEISGVVYFGVRLTDFLLSEDIPCHLMMRRNSQTSFMTREVKASNLSVYLSLCCKHSLDESFLG